MILKTHGDRKYHDTTSRLVGVAEFPHLRVEHRFLEAGFQRPGVCVSNELAFVLSGRAFAIQEGNGLTRRDFIQPGIACICPEGTDESVSGITSPIECLHIFLPPTLIQQSALEDYDIDPSKAELVYSGGLRDAMLHQIAMNIHGVASRGVEQIDRLFLDGMQAALAAHLIGNYSVDRWRRPSKAPNIDAKRLKRVLDFIEARFAENITLHDLAAEAHLSDFHFLRLFREATGLSPHRYLTYRRVQEAQTRLALNHSSLVDIALETGFRSQGNFIRAFRNATGLTPGQYRALRQPGGER
ncbi:helix-turn-helix domain-containing protein [Bradyrhizobium sp. UFLA05-112]